MKTILSIDGGGIRGMIPALVIAEIEKRLGKPACQVFDFIAGTSTGGILALGLARPSGSDSKSPRYSANDLAQLYSKEGEKIFQRSIWHRVEALGNLAGPRYDGTGAADVFGRYFQGWNLKTALTNVLVTAYEIESRMPYFFRSWEAARDPTCDYAMMSVALATSAAPTYFPPAKLSNGQTRVFIDGGVFANNPTMCAISEVKKLYPLEALLVVSLGTGNADRPITFDNARDWGLAAWAEPLLDVLIDGVSDVVDVQSAMVVTAGDKPGHYYRFQTDLPRDIQEMDDVRPKTIELLGAWAERLIVSKSAALDEICAQLAARA